jgi:hypothetical protein
MSCLVRTHWPARRALEAGCFVHGPRPAMQHHCGIHAFADQERALDYADQAPGGFRLFGLRHQAVLAVAVGRVSAWGHIVCHAHGWRAQYAYPYDISVATGDPGLVRGLADRYAVDVGLLARA